jgi:hypothetical protein
LAACANVNSQNTPTYKKEQTMSETTPTELILSIHGKQDITPEQVEKEAGIQVELSNADPQKFGTSGRLAGNGSYSLISVSDGKGQAPRRLDFEFGQTPDATPAACAQTIELYRRALLEGGFGAKWIAPPRLGSSASWHFERGDVVVSAFVGKDARQDDPQACISTLQILAAP